MQYSYNPYVRQQPTPEATESRRRLTVYGNGKVSVEPNVVSIQLAVVTENQSLSQAQQENAQTMNQVIQSLLNLGISQEDIQTASYTISPKYDYEDGKQIDRGYQVSNAIRVIIKDLNQIGIVIDTAVQQGVNRVSNIVFTTDHPQAFYEEALRFALEDGGRKARTITDSLQLNLDQIPVKIIEQTESPPVAYKTFATTAESFATPIEPGQIEIEAAVELIYQY
ncbi:DUF541 domain-containing protein [Agaribacter marinus]|uniref:SIMPL domain-containing protein n=1 Tax=Virgibacillus salarius TaxID=447199 RepID=A0A941DSI2_9BACI|nr:SIMPL domain-containing protein [Virgibacillus salarius]MBR7794576.1 SIMPL domain-containing protein [Virgibacillus salarius]NAZ07298.1 DUF541 domain-containing protein [Agaribacter marinus]